MLRSLILSLSVLPMLGWAIPATTTTTTTTTDDDSSSNSNILSSSTTITVKQNNLFNITKQADTENYFPDPTVHCSGRYLDDEGDSNWSADLDAAVTASGSDGLYGSCDVSGDEVDGYGSLAFSSGTVQVYYCNHAFAAQGCSLNEYWRADDLINDKCGESGGGWVSISSWGKTIGRDPTNSDGSFRSECGDSLHGPDENFALTNATRVRR